MKAFCVLALLLALGAPASAEDPFAAAVALLPQEHQAATDVVPLTLTELESAALAHNPEVRLAARRVAIAEAGQPAAGALDDPMLMYRGWGVPLRQPWNLNRAQNMFMFSQTLPGRGKRGLRSQIAGQSVEIAKQRLEAVRREVRAEVRVAFYELLRNQQDLRLHDEQVQLARQALQSASIKYTVGRVPQQDVLKAQVALTKLIEHVLMFEQEGELARARLNTLLGREPWQPLRVMGEYELPRALPSMAELQQVAMENRPELKAARLAIEQAQTRSKLAEKAYTPDFQVGGGYMLMPGGTERRNAYMAELFINLPWLNRRKHDAEIAEAQREVSAIEAEYEAQRALVLREIREAAVRAEVARRLAGLYQETLRPQAQSVLKAAAAAYQTDRTDFLNLLDSQNILLDVEYAYQRALSEFDTRMAELERAIGADVPGTATENETNGKATAEVRR